MAFADTMHEYKAILGLFGIFSGNHCNNMRVGSYTFVRLNTMVQMDMGLGYWVPHIPHNRNLLQLAGNLLECEGQCT